jgi:transposase
MDDAKTKALRQQGTLNRQPGRVNDEVFRGNEFFDRRDVVQVKYEMLRRVRVDGLPAAQAAQAFGVSRMTFYQAQASFHKEGLPGLIPKRRGPRQAHKLSSPVLEFIDQQRATDKTLHARQLVGRTRERFGLSVHPRSIERALSRRTKKGRPSTPK